MAVTVESRDQAHNRKCWLLSKLTEEEAMPTTHPTTVTATPDEEKRMREVCYALGWFMLSVLAASLVYAMFF